MKTKFLKCISDILFPLLGAILVILGAVAWGRSANSLTADKHTWLWYFIGAVLCFVPYAVRSISGRTSPSGVASVHTQGNENVVPHNKPLQGPFLAFIAGVGIFMLPFCMVWFETLAAPDGSKGEAGWGGIIFGIFLWPAGFALGVSGLVITLKRIAQNHTR